MSDHREEDQAADPPNDGVALPWPDEVSGPFMLTLKWQVIDGRAECVGLDLSSADTPLTASHIRQLRFGRLVEAARSAAADRLTPPAQAAHRVRSGTAERLAEVAEVYREGLRTTGKPTSVVAQRLGLSRTAAAKVVFRARAAGLLPPTSPGVAVARDEPETPESETATWPEVVAPATCELPDPSVEPTIGVRRAAGILGVSARAAYAAAERGELPAIHVGRSVRVPTARFLAAYRLADDAHVEVLAKVNGHVCEVAG